MVTRESTRLLLISNAIAAVLAIALKWPLETLLWPYWIQSVFIGWYSRQRMLALKQFSTQGLKMNGKPVPETPQALRSTANFFAFHYGGFHLGYFAFLAQRSSVLSVWDWAAFAAMALSFATSHRASFRQNLDADLTGRPNLGLLMFLPYARVLPMHVTILVGGTLASDSAIAIVVFSGLKTAADVLMHHVEHKVLQRTTAVATA
jgi:hypothetical protein